MRRFARFSVATALGAMSMSLLTTITGVAAAAPTPKGGSAEHQRVRPVLDSTGRIVASTKLVQANRNAATLAQLRKEHATRAKGAHTKAKPAKAARATKPQHLPRLIAQRKHDGVGYLPLVGTQPPTARTIRAYRAAALTASTATKPRGRAVQGRALSSALMSAPTAAPATVSVSTGSISGTVTDKTSGAPLLGVCVSAYGDNGNPVPDSCTDASGAYSITGLVAGSYYVTAEDHVSSHITADVSNVLVTSGADTSHVDIAMVQGGSISGHVTDSANHPLAGVCANADNGSGDASGGGCTDANGNFQTTGVPAGSYSVSFYDTNDYYETQWYNGKSSYSEATKVDVTVGAITSGIGAAMVRGGSISGTITGSDGSTAVGVCGSVRDVSTGWWAGDVLCSDNNGHYTTSSLATGNYKIEFSDTTGTYLDRWYPSATSYADATAIAVVHGVDTSGTDMVLPVAGHITGTVVDANSNAPLQNVCVETESAYDACTDANGHYDIGGLETGSHYLYFYDNSGNGYLPRVYHDLDPAVGDGTAVAVTAGAVTSADVEHLVLGGRISGRVLNTAGTPLSDVCVDTPEGSGSSSCTDAAGNYTIVGLPAGSYHLEFFDGSGAGYLPRHYDDVDVANGAGSTLTVALGATTTALDEHLVLGGSISGVLSAVSNGAPLDGEVDVYDVANSGDYIGWAETDPATGAYTVRGLDTGSYKVDFDPYNGFFGVWYGGGSSFATATTVSVTRGVTTTGIDAAAHEGGKISGTVTDGATGSPISGVCVDASDSVTQNDEGACTGADGTYTITGLPTADYVVSFDGAWAGYVGQTLGNPVHAAVDTTTSSVDAQLTKGGTIAGVITDGSGSPISSTGDGLPCANALNASGDSVGAAHCADSTGHYVITGLPAGDYTVQFTAPTYITEYYNDAPDIGHATPVHVDLGATTDAIDASLAVGGHITGTITDSATGLPPADTGGLAVQAYDGNGDVIGYSAVNELGDYDVNGLPTGSFTLQFLDYDGNYATQWYDGVTSQAAATPISVTAGHTTSGINAALNNGGSITGQVTEGSGQPLGNVCVQAFLASDTLNAVSSACSDSSGNYRVSGLTTGTYLVEFVPQSGPYLPQWANNKPDSGSADFVSVTFGQNTSGVNATLARGAAFSGTVTDKTTGTPLSDVCVATYSVGGGWLGIPETCSDSTGHYSTVGLTAGDYEFEYYAPGDYVGQWWDNATTEAAATTVTLTTGEDRTGADVAFVTGGHISGSVTDTNAASVDAWVDFYDAATSTYVAGTAAWGGSYVSPALAAGSYKVLFTRQDNDASLWYDAKADSASANAVAVTVGTTTSGINATFTAGATGSVTGTVTGADTNQPLSGVCVNANPTSSGPSSWGCTDDTGHYTISNVPVGDYNLYTYDTGAYLSAPYSTAGSTAPATVTVTDGGTASGIDFALTRGATVSGTITDAGTGLPLSNICVNAVPTGNSSGGGYSWYACSDDSGHYQTPGIAGGSYQLEFFNNGGRYLTQWYTGAATQAGATPVTLTDGTDTPINAAMTLGAAISGTVTDASTTHGVPNVCVTFHDATTGAPSSFGGCTDSTGHYSAVVPAGSYKVQFSDDSGAHVDQWWNNKPDAASADTLTVAAGDARTGIGAVMTAPSSSTGSVSGLVEDQSSTPVGGATVTLCSTATQSCTTTTSDGSGAFSFTGQAPGGYDLTGYPAAGSGLNWGHTTVQITAGLVTQQNLTLTTTTPLAPSEGVTVNGTSTGTPTAFWTEPVALTADGCTGGSATYSVTDASGAIIQSGSLTESATAGHYTGNMPALYPNRGTMTMTIAITCPTATDNKTASFTMYIDPSGTVKDTSGHPLAGATVTLLQSATQNGTYTAVPNGSTVMSPSNRNNPDATDASGHYGWDVVAGWYKVSAQHPDCYAPNTFNAATNTVNPVVTSAAQQIPPAVTNLDLVLDCTNEAPVAAFTQSKSSGQTGMSVHFDASGSHDANGAVASYSWDFGDGTTGTGVTVDHVYSGTGTFIPTLTVTDDQGLASGSPKSGSAISVGDVPAQIGGISATSGVHQVSLSWTAPNSHNSPITHYAIDVSPGGQHIETASLSAVVTNLTANAKYTFSLTAVNAYGASPTSTIDAVAGAAGTAPTVSITSAPNGYVNSRAGSVSFTVTTDPSVSVVSVTCSLDGAAAAVCSSPMSFSGLADGTHNVAVTVTDTDGNVRSASTQWVVDATAPTATQTAPTSMTSLGPILARWAGSDASGVTTYDVRYTKAAWNGRAGAAVMWKSATTATSAAFSGVAGYEYCFSARARDAAGNLSGWSAAKCAALPLDDRALAASSGWKKVGVKSAYNRTVMQTAASGKTLTRKGAIAGRAVLYVTTGKGYGTIVVLYNGKVVKKLSLAATRTHYHVAIALPKITKSTTIVVKTKAAKTVQIDGLLLARF